MTSTIPTARTTDATGTRSRRPVPTPTPDTEFYWTEAAAGRLVVRRCLDCDVAYFYPRDFCPECLSTNVDWMACSGRATLHTFVIEHRPGPGYEDDLPYVVAVVDLEEGARMMTNIVGVDPDPDSIELDMPLTVVFERRGEIAVPMFEPASGAAR